MVIIATTVEIGQESARGDVVAAALHQHPGLLIPPLDFLQAEADELVMCTHHTRLQIEVFAQSILNFIC